MATMKSFLAILLLLALTATSWAFQPVRPSVAAPSSTALNVFGNKKAAAAKAAEKAEEAAKYWQGEWVCKDCGYIYNRVCQRLDLL